MVGRRAKRFAVVAGIALVVAVSAVLAASAAPAPRVMKLGCASDLYGMKKVLRYVGRASECRGRGDQLVRFGQPVLVCLKEHVTTVGLFRVVALRSRAPAGLMRLVDSPRKCRPGSRLYETPRTLPAGAALWFCAARTSGELRLVRKSSACGRLEFRVTLPKRDKQTPGGGPVGTPGEPPAQGEPPSTNHAPVSGADTAATDESTARVIAPLGNDTDADGDALHIGSIDTTGTTGSATVNGDGTVTYDPDGRLRWLKAGETATDTFTYRASDGTAESAPATVTVTVTGLNEAPTAVADAATTSKSHTAQIAVLSNDTDVDGDPLHVASVDTAGTHGTVTVASTGVITYDPNHQFDSLGATQSAHDTFKYKANDGRADSSAVTVDVTVTGSDTSPVVTTSAGQTAYTEGAAAAVVDGGLTVGDPDSANLASGQVRLSGGFQAGDELLFTAQNGIAGSYDSSTGVLTLTGNTTKANWQTALRSVRYRSGSNDNPSSPKTVEFKVDDSAQGSTPATKLIAVTAVNDAPAMQTSSGQASYTQGGAAVKPDPAVHVSDPDSTQLQSATVAITTNFTQADGDTLSFSSQNGISGAYNASTGVLSLSGTATMANYQTALQSVTYSLTSQTPSTATRTVSFRATDTSGAQSNAATRNVTVTATPADPLDAIIDHDLTFAATQLQRTLGETAADAYPQETGSDGRWMTTAANQWTSGFFPGSLWLMYQATGNSAWRTAAQARQAGIESQKTNTDTHDVGFMLFDSFGNGYRLTGTDSYRQVALTAAQSLATRYSPTVGAIRSWNNNAGASATDFQVIIDNLMNLELLFWASKHGGSSTLADEALQHALTTIGSHVRSDGSTWHLVVFNSDDGSVKRKGTVQGYSDSSTWARGQAWGVYGFTMAYRESSDARMLTAARRLADYYIAHLPADKVPYWDFQAPGIPNEPRDSSAAAIAASGLIELSQLETDATRRQRYLDTARATLTSLSSSAYLAEGTSTRSILLHGTANKPGGHSDRGLVYGDYYFLEALLRYRALN